MGGGCRWEEMATATRTGSDALPCKSPLLAPESLQSHFLKERMGRGRRRGKVKQTRYHINCTVHVPKQDDKYFTRCSLYNITAETSNF